MLSGRGIDTLTEHSVSANTKCLYLSDNEFSDLSSLCVVPDVEEVIADGNFITECLNIPILKNLTSLSLNKNKISDLEVLLDNLPASNVPKLSFLSLVGNPVCPDNIFQYICGLRQSTDSPVMQSVGSDAVEFADNDDEYARYRLRLIYRLPQLRFLDSTPVTPQEREEAKKRGPYLLVVRADETEKKKIKKKKKNEPNSTQKESDSALMKEDCCEEVSESSLPSQYHPLPDTSRDVPSWAAFGKCRYVYEGKHSEGNRFITNHDL